MGLLFGRREVRQIFPEPVIPPYPGANVGGTYGTYDAGSNPDTALTVSTVWACVMLLANAVSSLPLETFKRSGAGVPGRAPDPLIVTSPADGMTQSEWLHMLMVSLLLRGNAFGHIVARDGWEHPTQIELMNPDAIRVEVDRESGELVYRLALGPRAGQVIPRYDVWHVRGMTMPGAKVGMSPIAYAAATLGIDLSARKFATDYFTGGGIPKAVLSTDLGLDQTEARTVKDRFLSAVMDREPAVLTSGVKYQQIQVNPEESQFLLTQQANVAHVARYFSIPPNMVGGSSGDSMTYANVEQNSIQFLTYAVSFWLKRIEDSIFPLLPKPNFVQFKTDSLLRTDAHNRALVDVLLIAGKVRTPTETRADRGWAPMTAAQKKEVEMTGLGVGPSGRVTSGNAPATSGPNDASKDEGEEPDA